MSDSEDPAPAPQGNEIHGPINRQAIRSTRIDSLLNSGAYRTPALCRNAWHEQAPENMLQACQRCPQADAEQIAATNAAAQRERADV